MSVINDLRDRIHQNAIDHGWYDEPRTFGDMIALCHSELSEALEEFRKSGNVKLIYGAENSEYLHDGEGVQKKVKPEGVAVELADVMIRILDMCGYYGLDIDEAIASKMIYNAGRGYRHGGKRL